MIRFALLLVCMAAVLVGCGVKQAVLNGEWNVALDVQPVLLFPPRGPDATQPPVVPCDSVMVMHEMTATGLCELSPEHTWSWQETVTGMFYDGPEVQCVRVTMPAYADAFDRWPACDAAILVLGDLTAEERQNGLHLEGGARIEGCGRAWPAVVSGTATRQPTAPRSM